MISCGVTQAAYRWILSSDFFSIYQQLEFKPTKDVLCQLKRIDANFPVATVGHIWQHWTSMTGVSTSFWPPTTRCIQRRMGDSVIHERSVTVPSKTVEWPYVLILWQKCVAPCSCLVQKSPDFDVDEFSTSLADGMAALHFFQLRAFWLKVFDQRGFDPRSPALVWTSWASGTGEPRVSFNHLVAITSFRLVSSRCSTLEFRSWSQLFAEYTVSHLHGLVFRICRMSVNFCWTWWALV